MLRREKDIDELKAEINAYSTIYYRKAQNWRRMNDLLSILDIIIGAAITAISTSDISESTIRVYTTVFGALVFVIAGLQRLLNPGDKARLNEGAGDDYKELSLANVSIQTVRSRLVELIRKYDEPSRSLVEREIQKQ